MHSDDTRQINFSVVIPTYNEEHEIGPTIECLLSQSYSFYELIIVDDSQDSTASVVRSFCEKYARMKLVPPSSTRRGRCEARNVGIKMASGNVIVVLNADVLLPTDFLADLRMRYLQGFDCVTVFAEVANLESPYARYVDYHHFWKLRRGIYERRRTELKSIYWSEGFSVRRSFALDTGLFPSGYPVMIEAGEDVRFVDQLRKAGARGIIDDNILLKHVAPDSLAQYWAVRKGRGRGTPQIRIFVDGWHESKVALVIAIKSFRRFVYIVTIIPGLIRSFNLIRSKNLFGGGELFKIYGCWIIEQLAFTVGEIESLWEIVKLKRFKL